MLNYISKLLFSFSVVFVLISYGILASEYHLFPYKNIINGLKTGKVLISSAMRKDIGLFQGFADIAPHLAPSNRIDFIASYQLTDPILFYGGRYQFSDYCPGGGCLAVEYAVSGGMAHAYPYRPDEIIKANITEDHPYETTGFDFVRDAYPIGIERYINGDLLVVFQNRDTFPYGGGVARVDRNGYPKWFRRDYSHHWPSLMEGEIALVPNTRIGKQSLTVKFKTKQIKINCETDKPYLDAINLLDGEGKLLQQISVIDAILDSPSRGILEHTTDPCDPIHLNYVIKLRDDIGSVNGMDHGDFVVSLRNLSAFAIIDDEDGRLKKLVRGTFLQQHSVEYLGTAKFLLFDNHGGDEAGGPSRLLMVDVASGTETTIFPVESTPETLRDLFSDTAGKIDISPDRQRVIVSFAGESKAIEVGISDGKILNIFSSLHNVSDLEQFSVERHTKAAKYRILGIDYINEYREVIE